MDLICPHQIHRSGISMGRPKRIKKICAYDKHPAPTTNMPQTPCGEFPDKEDKTNGYYYKWQELQSGMQHPSGYGNGTREYILKWQGNQDWWTYASWYCDEDTNAGSFHSNYKDVPCCCAWTKYVAETQDTATNKCPGGCDASANDYCCDVGASCNKDEDCVVGGGGATVCDCNDGYCK